MYKYDFDWIGNVGVYLGTTLRNKGMYTCKKCFSTKIEPWSFETMSEIQKHLKSMHKNIRGSKSEPI